MDSHVGKWIWSCDPPSEHWELQWSSSACLSQCHPEAGALEIGTSPMEVVISPWKKKTREVPSRKVSKNKWRVIGEESVSNFVSISIHTNRRYIKHHQQVHFIEGTVRKGNQLQLTSAWTLFSRFSAHSTPKSKFQRMHCSFFSRDLSNERKAEHTCIHVEGRD